MPSASPAKTAAITQNATISTRGLTKVYGAGPSEVCALQGVDLGLAREKLTAYDKAELTRFRRASVTPTAMSPRAHGSPALKRSPNLFGEDVVSESD